MSEKPLRFAVVGLGMGQAHCHDINDARGAELVAVCDLVPERVEAMTKAYGCRGTTDFAEILAAPDIDVVNIATPSGMHAEHTIAALRAGKHVICEKPPEVTVAKVDSMIAAQRETGKKLMIIFQSRFEPLYRRLRQTIQDGRLGRLIGVHATVHWYREQSYFTCPGMWKGTWALDGGGSLANQGVHTVDLIQWLCGPVVEVYGKYGVYAHDIEAEDKTVAVLEFANGALGTLTSTTALYPGMDTELIVHGERGTIHCQAGLRMWRIRGETPEAEAEEERQMMELYGPGDKPAGSVSSDPFAFATRGHLAQVEDMVQAIREDREPYITAESTRHTVEILNAIYQSARDGRPVRLG
ncbi:MAG: Gfo/Idh/MocA family oxidoreductase [Armatimonadetes bacterium]|jgi:UDP-N-acetyl-2-amino-2-deoxyglucuronate dehydrogenase|nr:Gfo/Idh/MocA family oxidoreductase [Armatimonadota bacterium]